MPNIRNFAAFFTVTRASSSCLEVFTAMTMMVVQLLLTRDDGYRGWRHEDAGTTNQTGLVVLIREFHRTTDASSDN